MDDVESSPAAGLTGPTWRNLLTEAGEALASVGDARRIVERASGFDAGELWSHLDEVASARAAAFVDAMVARRAAGEPLQYVVGVWGFRGLDLLVDRRVLIPRPETEQVTDAALAEADRLAQGEGLVVADLGTGSGAIALSIAAERPGALVWATDVSPEALAVARANLAGLGSAAATRVALVEGHWFEALPADLRGRIDLVVANPPYVATDEALPEGVSRWEPATALRAGPEGLDAIAEIVAGAPAWLGRPGSLVVELAPRQAAAALALACDAGSCEAFVKADLAGRDRALVARWDHPKG